MSELRRHLETRLADYMIPSTFLRLDGFPTTIAGKVDRNVLPAPNRSRPDLDQPYRPPNTMLERKLAQIWGDLLQLDRVGIDDNFFELGGHSLLATQLVNRIRDSLQVAVTVRELFGSPTVGRLAELIETMNWLTENAITADLESETETF